MPGEQHRHMDGFLQEMADRQAIRDLVHAYARRADRGDAKGMAGLFTEDGRLAIHEGDVHATDPVRVRRGRDELVDAFARLDRYDVTTHFLGQHTVTIDGDRATGETYCLAHHLFNDSQQRINLVMAIRYIDVFVRHDAAWLIADRRLAVDWVERRPSPPHPL
jgi:hypothetical protein